MDGDLLLAPEQNNMDLKKTELREETEEVMAMWGAVMARTLY